MITKEYFVMFYDGEVFRYVPDVKTLGSAIDAVVGLWPKYGPHIRVGYFTEPDCNGIDYHCLNMKNIAEDLELNKI